MILATEVSREIYIAPFWEDVDTRGAGTVSYRETTNAATLCRVQDQIRSVFPSQDSFSPSYAFITTWDGVGYYNQNSDLVCNYKAYIGRWPKIEDIIHFKLYKLKMITDQSCSIGSFSPCQLCMAVIAS